MTDAVDEGFLTFMTVSRRLRVRAPRTTDYINILWRHTDATCMPGNYCRSTVTVRMFNIYWFMFDYNRTTRRHMHAVYCDVT
jgi:hypothetical protein